MLGRIIPLLGDRLAIVIVAAVAGFAGSQAPPPYQRGAAIPLVPESIFGHARFKVVVGTNGETTISTIDSEPKRLAEVIAPDLRRWTFTGSPSERFVDVDVVRRPTEGCPYDSNRLVEIKWPTEIQIHKSPFVLCEDEADHLDTPIRVRSAEGTVVDGLGRPLSGVSIAISARTPDLTATIDPRSHILKTSRMLRTDVRGRFVGSGLPDGVYSLGANLDGFIDQEFTVVIAHDAAEPTFNITLRRNSAPAKWPDAVVTAADIPLYPSTALTAGREGVVDLRLSLSVAEGNGNVSVTDIDSVASDADLARAARQNVASWRFDRVTVPVLSVKFVYRLTPGDCSSDQRPTITLKFPSLVEVSAKRLISCRIGP